MIGGSVILLPFLSQSSVEGIPLGAMVTPNTIIDDFDYIGEFDSNSSLGKLHIQSLEIQITGDAYPVVPGGRIQ